MGSATYDCDIATCFYGGTFDLKWGTVKAELTFNKEDQTKEKGFFFGRKATLAEIRCFFWIRLQLTSWR